MVSTSRAIQLGFASLAALALSGWQTANAQCNTSAWSGVNGTPLASGPNDTAGFVRYSGSCGLRAGATAPSNVNETARHSAEGSTASPMHARFFVYTGISAGSPVVFQGRDSGGTPVVSVTYNRATQNFTFDTPGTDPVTANGSAPANRWIEVGFSYQAGQPFTAQTRHIGVTTSTTPTANLSGTAPTIEEVRFGLVSGSATGTMFFDEYEASRAIGGASFTLLCRGDANGSGEYELEDIFGVVDEFLRNQGDTTRIRATGQPDIDQNGLIELTDIFGVVDAFLALQAGSPGSGCSNAQNQ